MAWSEVVENKSYQCVLKFKSTRTGCVPYGKVGMGGLEIKVRVDETLVS